jgi:hypothetical protein
MYSVPRSPTPREWHHAHAWYSGTHSRSSFNSWEPKLRMNGISPFPSVILRQGFPVASRLPLLHACFSRGRSLLPVQYLVRRLAFKSAGRTQDVEIYGCVDCLTRRGPSRRESIIVALAFVAIVAIMCSLTPFLLESVLLESGDYFLGCLGAQEVYLAEA